MQLVKRCSRKPFGAICVVFQCHFKYEVSQRDTLVYRVVKSLLKPQHTNDAPKMKRDARVKVVFFSREKDFHSGIFPHFRAFIIRSAFNRLGPEIWQSTIWYTGSLAHWFAWRPSVWCSKYYCFVSNLKMPACASKQDVLEGAHNKDCHP